METLIVHPDKLEETKKMFEDVGVQVKVRGLEPAEPTTYTMGVDVGTGTDFTAIRHSDGRVEIKGRKHKTGRRETRLAVTLRTSQRQGKPAKCGHQVISYSQPKTHCFDCWHYWFSINVKIVYSCFAYLEKGEAKQIEEVHGKTFLKHFKRFVSYVQSLAPIVPEDAVSVEGAA